MRTRSSRLFIVLLHLVSVSTDIIHIGGVHNPQAIVLQRLQWTTADGLHGILLQHHHQEQQQQLQKQQLLQQQQQLPLTLEDPFWLQDETDGLCLSPVGFSECSETTLWYVREPSEQQQLPQQQQHRRRRQQRQRSVPITDLGYALEYVEPSSDGQCLHSNVVASLRKRRRNNNSNNNKMSLLLSVSESLGSCQSSQDQVFVWNINGEGILHTKNSESKSSSQSQQQFDQHYQSPEDFLSSHCLWRINATATLLDKCTTMTNTPQMNNNNALQLLSKNDGVDATAGRRMVHLSLIRHVPAAVAHEREVRMMELAALQLAEQVEQQQQQQQQQQMEEEEEPEHIPRSKDAARRHASEPLHHAEVKSASSMVVAAVPGGTTNKKKPLGSVVKATTKTTKSSDTTTRTKLFTLKDTNPILFIGGQGFETKSSSSSSSLMLPAATSAASYKLRRLETHPYLASAKNNVWTDPQTGLEYPTDLCSYLGHDLKKAGRHTLTGVGYYTKTVLNIKIYGVALYISKKDALADAVFERYAALSADELRKSPEFYDHLREMPSPLLPKSGLVDRTILLKLNMQLSMETMQSSLRATWKLLTEERKNLLINSSMKARPAEERMLRTIQSPHNPGRCSCGQVAPPEYNADRDCCARGTELVFTWRKNGDLEIRVDGRIVDTFPRPDVAKGIFYEYLRTDDPISPDFANHVVDGFPFLLGPLAQVKGMHVSGAIPSNDAPPQEQHQHHERGLGRVVGNFADMLANHAGEFVGWAHQGATGAASHMANAAKSIGSTANSVKEGLERRRDQWWSQVSALPEHGRQFLLRKLQVARRHDDLAASVAHYLGRQRRGETQISQRTISGPRGRVFRSSVSHWFGSSIEMDEELGNAPVYSSFLGNLVFVYLVHLYLLLLLVVSLPGTHQTKLVVARRSKALLLEDSNSRMADDASTESSSTDESPTRNRTLSSDTWTIGNDPIASNRNRRKNLVSIFKEKRCRSRSRGRLPNKEEAKSTSPEQSGMKKSLSYYL